MSTEDEQHDEAVQTESDDDRIEEEATRKNDRKALKKKRKEQLKSKTTGVGLKISLEGDSTPSNKKIIFDDTNLPGDDAIDDNHGDSGEEKSENTRLTEEDDVSEDDDDDDAVEEVQGMTARDKALDQLKIETEQSLKTKKKRKRKTRIEKPEAAAPVKSQEPEGDEDEEMDDAFFAQLESLREIESEKRKELEKTAARAKGKHTTFVFEKNECDTDVTSDPVQIDENIQVVVLKNPSSTFRTRGGSLFMPDATISKKGLTYSRNALKDGSDRLAGEEETKRKKKRSGEEIHPWKRANPRLTMGRSRLKKGKPAAFFKRKRR